MSENASSLYFTNARARGAVSTTATGLTYNNSTGVLSLTTGYIIPLTATTTEWDTAYSRSVSSWTSPLQFSAGTASIAQSDASTAGYISSTDWNTFNNKVGTSRTISTSAPLSGGGDLSANRTLSISQSGVATDGYLSTVDWNTFNGKQAALGFTPEDVANKSTVTTLGTSDTLYPSQKAVKTYIDNKALGLNWLNPVELINVVADASSPPGSPVNLDGYIINTGGATGVWSTFASGDLVQYQTPSWVKIKSLVIGDRFGVAFKSVTTPSGSMTGKTNYEVQVTGGTAGAFTYTFTAPTANDALFVQNTNAYYHNVTFTYSSSLIAWVQLSASVDLTFTNGFTTVGNVVSLGNLTSNWNQTAAFDIVTAGDINVNGADLKTTALSATLFNTNATTLNIGGAATTIGLGAAGATVTGGGALTINSGTATALGLDSGTTGAVNLGTGNSIKTISIGTGTAGNTINIGTNNTTADTISIGSALDAFSLASTGLNITTGGALTGVASIDTITHSATAITFAGAGTISSTGANAMALDSGTTGSVNIGTGASAKTITLGNTTLTTALNINTGTGGSTFTTTNGIFNLNTGTGAINLGTDAVAKTITIGNGTGATAVVLNAGSGGIDIGANAVARTINIGTGAAVIETINLGGTGANIISVGNTQTAGSISLGAAMTGGTISIGGTGLQTGNFDLAPGTGAQTVALANNSGIKTINIGSGTSGNTVSLGNGANTVAQTINIASGAAAANSTVNILTGIATAGTQTLNLGTGSSAKTINIGNTSGASAVTLDSGTGAINIGTTIAKTLTLGNTAGATRLNLNAGTGGVFANGFAAAASGHLVVCIDNATKQLFVGSSNTTCNTSSERFKHDIQGIALGLDAINNLRPVSFTYNANNERALGFIAEDVASVDERLIIRDEQGLPFAINPDYFIPILTKAIQQVSVYVGDVSPLVNPDGSDNGLSTLVATIQTENAHDPVAIISSKITDGKQFLTDFIAARVTAIRGYFDEVFTKKIHTEQLCVKKSDNSEVCVTGDQIDELLRNSNATPSAPSPVAPSETPPTTTDTTTPPIVEPAPVESSNSGDTAVPSEPSIITAPAEVQP